MKFLIDENLDKRIAHFLKELQFSTEHIQNIQIGLDDTSILDLAFLRDAVVVTFDKDFGELVFKKSKIHKGVILLRLENQTLGNTITALKYILKKHKTKIVNNFIVLVEKDAMFRIRVKAQLK